MTQELHELANNPAFWTFLGILVTSFFGYKQVMKKSPAAKIKASARNASSFEELRSVVEVLQNELLKKDKRHKDDTDYMLSQLTEARNEVRNLSKELTTAVRAATLAEDRADKCHGEVERLKKRLLANGISE